MVFQIILVLTFQIQLELKFSDGATIEKP